MKKHRSILFKLVVAFLILAPCGLNDQPFVGRASSTVQSFSLPASRPRFASQTPPDVPTIVEQLYLGVPAGNGHAPQRVAVDSESQRLFTFNNGLPEVDEGNTISVVDLKTSEVTDLIRLNNMPRQDPLQGTVSLPSPLDIQVDPYRPRLYVLWGDLYASPPYSNLTIIDLDDLTILDTLPGVLAVAPGPDRLYLADQSRLSAVDPVSGDELNATDLKSPREASNPQSLLLSPSAKRLYLSHSPTLESYDADTLTLVNTYTAPAQLMQAAVDEANDQVLVIDHDDDQAYLRALDSDGHPLTSPAPFVLTDDTYSDPRLVVVGSAVVATNRRLEGYSLEIFSASDLSLTDNLAILPSPTDLAADLTIGHLYLTYWGSDSYILALDPTRHATNAIYTALTVNDALADPATNRLYVLNNAHTLQVLNLTDYTEITRLDIQSNLQPASRSEFANPLREPSTSLTFDPTRQRLYLSGDPVQVIDTEALTITATLDIPGQLTPDPASDRLYLTPPCQCRTEQCNTLILNADTLTGTTPLFPPQDPQVAPCIFATTLDAKNRLLYTRIDNGIPGSNSGSYFSVFDVSGPPQLLYTDGQISYGEPALDPARARAFMPRYRLDRSFLHRFDRQEQGQTITQTLELAGAEGRLSYDPQFDRLYVVPGQTLQVFDGDLALLAEISLPSFYEPLTFDSPAQRLYLGDANGNLLVVATSGGQLEAPSSQPSASSYQLSANPFQLFVAPTGDYFQISNQRLYRSTQDGQSLEVEPAGGQAEAWELLGQGLPNRPVRAFAISPNYQADHTLLAGLTFGGRGGGGLYRSTDGGDTWQPTTRGLTDLEVSQIVFSPTFAQDQIIFLTTDYRGLFRSTDGGDTWLPLADTYATDPSNVRVSSLAMSPAFASDRLVLITTNHLLRSSDGGNTWVDTGLPPGQVVFSPNFAEDKLILSDGRWRSTDGGQTWQPAAAGLEPNQGTQSLFFSPNFATDQTVYLILYQQYDQPLQLQRSIDAGRTWQSLLGGLHANFGLAAATILPNGDLYLTGREGQPLTLSSRSLTWGRPTIDLTQLDLQDMVISPEGMIFVANSVAGVFKSADGGGVWTDTNFPARADETKIARLALAGDGTLFAATGSIVERSDDGGQTWMYLSNLPSGFEVTALAVSPNFATDGVVLVGGNYASKQLLRSTDRGKTWQIVFDGNTVEGASDVAAIAFSPNFASDKTVYAWLQYGGLVRSTDGGQTWSLVSNDKSDAFAQTLALSPDGRRLYLGTLYGGLYVSEDDGQTWRDLTENIPDERTWSSALAFGSGNTLLLGTDIGVYRSPDGGQSWSRANTGLSLDPNQNKPTGVRALAFSGPRLYAALTQGGLYVSDDQGQTWHSAN